MESRLRATEIERPLRPHGPRKRGPIVNGSRPYALWRVANISPVVNLSGFIKYELNDPPLVIAPYAGLVDPDSENFAKGKLTMKIATNAHADDRLTVKSTGTERGRSRALEMSFSTVASELARFLGARVQPL